LRTYDQRRPAVPRNLVLRAIQAELAEIVMHVVGGAGLGAAAQNRLIAALALPLLVVSQFFLGVEFLLAKTLRTLERRESRVGPEALNVRLAVNRSRDLVVRSLRRYNLTGDRRREPRDRQHQRQNTHRRKRSILHGNLPYHPQPRSCQIISQPADRFSPA